jgi:beta-lactamase class A
VAHEVLRQVDAGRFKLDDRLLIEPRDTVEPEPARGLDAGDEVTVREALRAMLGVSSNSAAHALLRLLDRTRFNASLRALGLRDTRVPLGHDEVATTTPADMALLLRELARGSVLRYESSAELRRLLTPGQDLNALADALPDDVEVLSKAGNLERASNVAALVSTAQGPVIICVFDEDVDPGDARQTIADLTRAVYAHHAR